MTQSDIDRAVARRTGESKALIRRMGFALLAPHAPGGPHPGVNQPTPAGEGDAARDPDPAAPARRE